MNSMKPKRGQFTFDNEGNEGGRYHSRRAHHPSTASGVTIGRGYDMKLKDKSLIYHDLVRAGVPPFDALLLSKGSGLSGIRADNFIEQSDIRKIEISQSSQVKLFDIEYSRIELDTKRLCEKEDVEKIYGSCNWESLNPKIKEFLIDLRYQGLYQGRIRNFIQNSVSNNDLKNLRRKFQEALDDLSIRIDSRNKNRLDFLNE